MTPHKHDYSLAAVRATFLSSSDSELREMANLRMTEIGNVIKSTKAMLVTRSAASIAYDAERLARLELEANFYDRVLGRLNIAASIKVEKKEVLEGIWEWIMEMLWNGGSMNDHATREAAEVRASLIDIVRHLREDIA